MYERGISTNRHNRRGAFWPWIAGLGIAAWALHSCDGESSHKKTSSPAKATATAKPQSNQLTPHQEQELTAGTRGDDVMLSHSFSYKGANFLVTCVGIPSVFTVKQGDYLSGVETTEFHNSSNWSEKPVPPELYYQAVGEINGLDKKSTIYPNEELLFPESCFEG